MSIRDYSDPVIRKMVRGKIAIIPVGSLEQHGPHLPVSTDSDIVTEVAQIVAKRCNLLLLPTITYGNSFEHAPFFNISTSTATLQRLLVEICLSLSQNKIHKVIILNGHHGNQRALKGIESKIHVKSGRRARVFAFSYWHFMKEEFDHAGFVETSLMLAISGKVKMKLARKGLISGDLTPQQRMRASKLAATHFIKATKNGVWGDPTRATKKDGERILSEITQNLSKTVSKLAY